VFNPIPPEADPPPAPPDEINEPDDSDGGLDADDTADLRIPPIRTPSSWPALVRWSRYCRVLAFVFLVWYGWHAAWYLYDGFHAIDSQVQPRMEPRATPGYYFLYGFYNAVLAVASCISLLGFAELLYLLMSIEATTRDRRDREPS
jgi:hypothetical protein